MSSCDCNLKVKTLNLGTKTCWSASGAFPATVYFVFSAEEGDSLLPALISQLRASVMNQNSTASFQSFPFFQLSEDSLTWDTPIAIDPLAPATPTYVVGNTQSTYGWYSATTNYKRYIRFGIAAQQVTGTPIAQANVSLIIDILLK